MVKGIAYLINYQEARTQIQWTSRTNSDSGENTARTPANSVPSFNEDVAARFSPSGFFVDAQKYQKIAEEIRRRIISMFGEWKGPGPGIAYDPAKHAPEESGKAAPKTENAPKIQREPPVEETPKDRPVTEPEREGRPKQTVYLNFRDDAFNNLGLSEDEKIEARNRTIEKVKEEYKDYNIEVVTEPPEEGEFTSIVIGGTSPRKGALGLAEYDPGNKDLSNIGYVYTQELPEGHDALDSVEEVGAAVGNIITHELGHTLGLDDHQDATDKEIMDGVMNVSSLPQNKYFTPANQELLEGNVGFNKVA
ncbi:MAG: hypothetical protein QME81_14505 [bacterium]|nr:hypothetical protein [bacterium]